MPRERLPRKAGREPHDGRFSAVGSGLSPPRVTETYKFEHLRITKIKKVASGVGGECVDEYGATFFYAWRRDHQEEIPLKVWSQETGSSYIDGGYI